jgi:hypothetical protein
MKIDLQNNSHANISFTTSAKVSIRGEHDYLVKWFRDGELIGDMNLGGGTWGSFSNEIGNWEVEFWQDNNLVKWVDFNLEGKNVLLFPVFQFMKIGKNTNLNSLQKFVDKIESKYKCNVYICFSRSELFDTNLKVLKMNDDLDFNIIIEKEF